MRVPWAARRSNQLILSEINPEYSLEGLILKLKRQYFGHLMRRADSLEKTLMLGPPALWQPKSKPELPLLLQGEGLHFPTRPGGGAFVNSGAQRPRV